MVEYKDTWWKLVAAFLSAHLVEVIGREESTLELLLTSFYYKDVISGTVVAWILLMYVSYTIKYLDRKYDWLQATLKRITIQFIFGVLICALLAYLLVNIQFRLILNQRMEQTTWFYYEFPFVVMMIVFFNGVYFVRYLLGKIRVAPPIVTIAEQVPMPTMPREVVHVKKGDKTIPIMVDEVAYIYKEGDYNFVRTFQNDAFRIEATLEELEALLGERDFFRANRQCIISVRGCKSFSTETFGKLKVSLNPVTTVPITISQKRAPAFKKWIDR